MGVLSKLLLITGWVFSLLSPRLPPGEAAGVDPVVRVEVTLWHRDRCLYRRYTDPHKMEAVLNHLRALDLRGLPERDPERVLGASARITVQLSSGKKKLYLQQADQFLSRELGPWRCVESRQAKRLYPLLQSLPSD